MKVTWLGHACFKIEDLGNTIIVDPYAPNVVPGFDDGIHQSADAVYCSHDHADHNFTDGITITDNPLNYEIEIIDSFHDDCLGNKRGSNKIFKFTFNGTTITHLGDLGHRLDKTQISQLKDTNILLIPVGGFYTIDADTAIEIINELQPEITIPMHYRSNDFGYDVIDTIDNFTSKLDNIIYVDKNSIDTADYCNKTIVLNPLKTKL